MNIYLLMQNINNVSNSFDAMVVTAENEIDAKNIHPSKWVTHIKNGRWMGRRTPKGGIKEEYEIFGHGWVDYDQIDKIKIHLIGVAIEGHKPGVICSSFNAVNT